MRALIFPTTVVGKIYRPKKDIKRDIFRNLHGS
jgi:hypothetical protein